MSTVTIEQKDATMQPEVEVKRPLEHKDCFMELGFRFSTAKKWRILTVIFIIQTSMNFNTSVYANAVPGMVTEFNVAEIVVRGAQAGCLLAYGIGSELWAPWSEDFGRWKILHLSLGLVNLCNIMSTFAVNSKMMVASRVLLGFCSAGGSVTLGMIADMWAAEDQQYAVAFVVFSSVAGSALGPIVGGFLQDFCSWRLVFYVQLGFGLVTQLLHLLLVSETRGTILMDTIARKRRNAARGVPCTTDKIASWFGKAVAQPTDKPTGPASDKNLFGPDEIREGPRITAHEMVKLWIRPFHMFLTEPIVLLLSLLSGFSDALIFTFLAGFTPVFTQWSFPPYQTGLCFLSIMLGYVLAYASFLPFIRRDTALSKKHPGVLTPERRLYWLLWAAPLEAVGLLGFAWFGTGPPVHWIAPLAFSTLVGVANYAIYMATVDYMIASYGPYAASATGGNALARDVLAGIAAFYAGPLYDLKAIKVPVGKPGKRLAAASTILAGLAALVTVPVYAFYWKGESVRARSPFAQNLEREAEGAGAREEKEGAVGEVVV